MAKRRTKKKIETKISEEVKVNDVPVIDEMIIEEPNASVSDDGFLAAEEEIKEPEVKVSKKTKVKDSNIDDGLIVEKKVVKKVHVHGGRFTV